jgi:hypothetical protein
MDLDTSKYAYTQCFLIYIMFSLDDLLMNYTFEEEFSIDECIFRDDKYHLDHGCDDVIIQLFIDAQYVNKAFLYIHGVDPIHLVTRQDLPERWTICLKLPNIAVRTFGSHFQLYLPDAVSVQRVVKLTRRFVSNDRRFIGNELLLSLGKLSFDVQGTQYTVHKL